MPFFIKDKSGKYRDSDGSWGYKHPDKEFNTSTAAQGILNTFSRMALAETEAKVVEE